MSKATTRLITLLNLKKEAETASKAYEDALRADIGTKLEYLSAVALSVAWKMNAVRSYMTPHDQVPLGDLMWVRDGIEVKSVTATTITIVRHLRGRQGEPVEMQLPISILSLSDRDMAKRVRTTVRAEKAKELQSLIKEEAQKESEANSTAAEASKKKKEAQTLLARAETWEASRQESLTSRKLRKNQRETASGRNVN